MVGACVGGDMERSDSAVNAGWRSWWLLAEVARWRETDCTNSNINFDASVDSSPGITFFISLFRKFNSRPKLS
jgi:hypothetical protein